MAIVQNTFTSAVAGAPFAPTRGEFNASLSGTFVATVQLERALVDAAGALGSYQAVTVDAGGGVAAFTVPVSFSISEPESTCFYRWNVTAFTSGTITARFGP